MSLEKKDEGLEGKASEKRGKDGGASEPGATDDQLTDAPPAPKVHLLDIGGGRSHKYGDCVLCQFGDVSVLIDGGHRGDEELVLGQLRRLLGQTSPVTVSLIIVSHPHDDHIGCLPSLVAQGELKADWALVCDPQYRWGREGDTDSDFAGQDPRVRGLAEAMLEHDRSDWDDEDLAGFADSVANLETRYRAMLANLEAGGTTVVRHATPEDAEKEEELLAAFAPVGLEVLGPSLEELEECHRLIVEGQSDARDSLESDADFNFNSPAAVASAYRTLVGGGLTDASRMNGGAINLQSLVVHFKPDGQGMIFGGDMQFADPQVDSDLLNDGVTQLRQRIKERAPYAFVKLSHHGSDNAFDEDVMGDYGETKLYGICCGDYLAGHHPHPDVLDLLVDNRREIDWVRTDRNGLVSITFGPGRPRIKLTRGRKDDPTKPTGEGDSLESAGLTDAATPTPPPPAPPEESSDVGHARQFTATFPPNTRRLSVVLELDPPSGRTPERAAAAEFSVVTDAGSGLSDSDAHEAGDAPPDELTINSADDVEAEPGNAEFLLTDADCNVPWRVARSLLTLREQVNRRAPRRNKASDGTIGDAAHCQRTSDHNPWVRDGNVGVVTALDITHDPPGGCDANTIAEAIRANRDPRVKYIIWNRRIANSAAIDGRQPWQWRPYGGTNPHTRHVHVSVKPDKASYDSTAAWAI
jgi:beta-lactamase superfamily II metal-dependent hydrolase